ncbi:MAG: hypothetical protein QNJ72_44190 [Pleurocapsa sp. MO_226.B13]|nr:hypothetical protein [Pleurocapsa sp. MO_226.B13]
MSKSLVSKIKERIADNALEYINNFNDSVDSNEKKRLILNFNSYLLQTASKLAEAQNNHSDSFQEVKSASEEDYLKVFEIIKSQEKQFITQLSEVRKYASTWLLGTLGGVSLLLVQNQDQLLFIDRRLLISLIAVMGALGLCMLWVLDRQVYHKLLNATILEGINIELSTNNVPTKVRTHTLRLTGQLGWAISIFYLFPIGFLLFISLSFFLRYYEFISTLLLWDFSSKSWWFFVLCQLILGICYICLIVFISILSKPQEFNELAKNISTFERGVNQKQNNLTEAISDDCSRSTRWEKIESILDQLNTLRDTDKKITRNWIWANAIVFIFIVLIQTVSLFVDYNRTTLSSKQEDWGTRLEIIKSLTDTDPNLLNIQVNTKINKIICQQLSFASKEPLKVDTELKNICLTEMLPNKKINISLEESTPNIVNGGNSGITDDEKKKIETQIELIENLLESNGVKTEAVKIENENNPKSIILD